MNENIARRYLVNNSTESVVSVRNRDDPNGSMLGKSGTIRAMKTGNEVLSTLLSVDLVKVLHMATNTRACLEHQVIGVIGPMRERIGLKVSSEDEDCTQETNSLLTASFTEAVSNAAELVEAIKTRPPISCKV